MPLGLAALAALALAGCTSVGPDYHRPELAIPSKYQAGLSQVDAPQNGDEGVREQVTVLGRDIAADWWTAFGSQALNHLVDTALQNNPDLASQAAALRSAQEAAAAGRAGLLPSVSANAGRGRQRSLDAGPAITTSYSTASIDLAYDIDAFGRVRRENESLQARVEYQRFQLEASAIALSANVVNTAIEARSTEEQLLATHELAQAQRSYLQVLVSRMEAGDLSQAEVAAQRSALGQAEASVPALEKTRAQLAHRLAVLTGVAPGALGGDATRVSSLELPREVPLSIPSQLLDQRPDIRAAEATLKQSSAELGVAIADMLPRLSITASYGSQASKISDLFSSGSIVWNLIGNIAQPLFDGGRRSHLRAQAQANLDQSVADYRSTVLHGLQEVADTLYAIDADTRRLRALVSAEKAAQTSLEIAKAQFDAGASDYSAVLIAQSTLLSTRLERIQAQTQRLGNTVGLYQALGGGWWNRSPSQQNDVAAPPSER